MKSLAQDDLTAIVTLSEGVLLNDRVEGCHEPDAHGMLLRLSQRLMSLRLKRSKTSTGLRRPIGLGKLGQYPITADLAAIQ